MRLPVKPISDLLVVGTLSAAVLLPAAVNAQSSPSAHTSASRYDNLGRIVGTIAPDPDGSGPIKHAATRTEYDTQGRPFKIETGELSTWKSEAIAPSAWGSSFTILSSNETTYDVMDRKIKTVTRGSNNAITGVTQYSYDNRGRLQCTAVRMNPTVYGALPASACTLGTAGSEGPDRIAKNIYDNASQILRVQKALGTPIQQDYVTYTYTQNGKQASVVDANGNRATYTYDGHDRLAKWNFPDKTSTGSTSSSDYEAYTYDDNGNKLTHRKRDGSVLSYQYDNLNQMTQKTVPTRTGLSSTHTRNVFSKYDLRGLQLRARFDGINGEGVTNSYDGFGRMTSSQINMSGFNKTLTYLNDKNGNRTRVSHPDGQQFNYEFDGLNRVDHIKRSTASLASFSYNNRGQQASLNGGVASSMSYDNIGRISLLTHNLSGSANDVTFGFSYSPASQVISRAISNNAYLWTGDVNVNRNYSVNGLNQYTGAGPANFTYDANGNLTSDGSSTYLYDVENRLVSATGSTTANLRYDPLGRLFETSGGSAGTTRFHQDGDELVAEYSGSNGLLRRYVHGASVDDPIIWYEGSGVATAAIRRLRANWQGSVVAIADSAGSAIQVNAYDDWGIPAQTNLGRFQYTGQAHIPELDMYYYKARIYSPTLGRFLQTDPIGYEDQVNLYAYVGNDPINLLDPTGMEIALATHRVGGIGPRHAKLVITPQNQDAYRDHPVFQNGGVDANGNVFITIGGGPDNSNGANLRTLVGDFNRPSDLIQNSNVDNLILNLGGRNEDQVISDLLGSVNRFDDDNLDYDLFPDLTTDGFNSNSFISGLLNANNLDSNETREITDELYGGTDPVPDGCFTTGTHIPC